MKILIADDEPLARQRLQSLLTEINPEFTILASAGNGLDALKQCIHEKPELVLLDIRMPKMDGLQAAIEITKAKLNTSIVFVTAYDEHALAAFNNNAIDYLLKPVKKERLKTMLEKVGRISFPQESKLANLPASPSPRKHLCAHSHLGTNIINLSNILCFKADNKYVSAITAADSYLIDDSLKGLEKEFPQQFFRVHRNALVNIHAIKLLSKDAAGKLLVFITGLSEPIIVSRRHHANLNAFLKNKPS